MLKLVLLIFATLCVLAHSLMEPGTVTLKSTLARCLFYQNMIIMTKDEKSTGVFVPRMKKIYLSHYFTKQAPLFWHLWRYQWQDWEYIQYTSMLTFDLSSIFPIHLIFIFVQNVSNRRYSWIIYYYKVSCILSFNWKLFIFSTVFISNQNVELDTVAHLEPSLCDIHSFSSF